MIAKLTKGNSPAEIEGLAATWDKPMLGFSHWAILGNWIKVRVNFTQQR